MSSILLPRISRVRLTGFDPIFKDTVEFTPPGSPGPYLILGGNGLGKTTILQAIVFGIAGEADEKVQREREDKRYMWNASLFRDRLADPRRAEVHVEFWMGPTCLTVRRGMESEAVRGVKIDDLEWVNSTSAQKLYTEKVTEIGGFKDIDDFRFLVHRLAYLPESRQSLVWHAEAQLAVFLLLCADPDTDAEIRRKAEQLKYLYNEMRHARVSVGNLQKRLRKAERDDAAPLESTVLPPPQQPPVDHAIDEINESLSKTNEEIARLLEELESAGKELQELSVRIESEEDHLAASEEQFVLRTLRATEDVRAALALHKLVVSEHCPYCAQENPVLASAAKQRLAQGLCPVCGLEHIEQSRPSEPVEAKRVLLASENRRTELLASMEAGRRRLAECRIQDAIMRSRAASLEFRLPRITARDKVVVFDDPGNLRSLLQTYTQDHSRLEKLHDDAKAEIEQLYTKHVTENARAYRLIETRARDYATAFLGVPCSFTRTAANSVDRDARFAFSVLIPEFSGKERTASTQCSESQAFFLDIAFRIALLEVAHQLSAHPLTFLCETPENALDIAYAENVADMFTRFSKAKGYSILTVNLQAGGVAEPLLQAVGGTMERKRRILDLLQHADLSVVQVGKREKLNQAMERLLTS